MKKWTALFVVLSLCAGLLTARAETQSKSTPNSLPGRQIAEHISLLTGVAISPLLGVGAVGAYQYFNAKTPEARAKLPWYANPLFWVPALLLVVACFIKDTAGTALPTAVKKPLDVAETIEHKISGLVATGAFVPIAASIFHASGSGDGSSLSGSGFAAIDLSWLYNGIMIPISMAAFFVVFLASNAINILILLSPFTTVDAALKGFRLFVLTTVAGTAAVGHWTNHPWIGAVWSLIVIVICYFIAGWSFRLSHFGLAFVWDFITFRRKRFTPDSKANKMFLGRKINRVPARTYGKLSRNEAGKLVLNYRPWLVLPQRTMELPEGNYAVGKGVFYSEILKLEGDEAKTALLLPPRYRSHEDELAKIYALTDVRDVGLRAMWAWLRRTLGFKAKAQPAVA